MRLITIFIILAVVLLIMWFFINNMDQVVEEFEVFQYSFYEVNLVNVLFGTFVFGLLLGYLLPVLHQDR